MIHAVSIHLRRYVTWRHLMIIAAFCTSTAAAREVNNLENIQREARIVADVMRSALREQLPQGMRATSVDAEYLAQQGVLLSVTLNTPWLVIHDDAAQFQFNGHINLEEIPTMVENILSDLQIDIEPYEPEALDALRALRKEQRDLRLEQRELRSKLRKTRRELVRAEKDKDRRELEEEIANLERELQAVDTQYDELTADIDTQYQELKDYRGGPKTPEPPTTAATDMGNIISRTVCDYGSTLRSLNSEDFLSVVLRRNDSTEYFVFKMDHVYSCGRNDMSTDRLLELAYQYKG